jgi:para-aminobenzoate synthetase component 1
MIGSGTRRRHPTRARVSELPYCADTPRLFEALAGMARPVYLDSGGCRGASGRYDIVAADPCLTLTTRGAVTEILAEHGSLRSKRAPLQLLRECLGERCAAVPSVPFPGGAIGYFAYDLGRRFEALPSVARRDLDVADMDVGVYDWAVVVDHAARRSWLVGQGRAERTLDEWDSLLARLGSSPRGASPRAFRAVSPLETDVDRFSYEVAFAKIMGHIRRGDCYQVNYARRFSAAVGGDPWEAYLLLRAVNPAPFSAFLRLPGGSVLSSSPERFLSVRGEVVQARPIKGTRARAAEPSRDRALRLALRNSEKDRAENVMIVDLLRNDLGKSCVPGSVHAARLFEVESFASVHHLVSTVEGRLAADKDALDLLAGSFPGGSVTGAPKVRAMQIIEALEPQRRGVYCGSIGYVGFDGDMDLNIAIRTLVHSRDRIYAWAGGGIVADSNVESEYQETVDKAAKLLAVITDP